MTTTITSYEADGSVLTYETPDSVTTPAEVLHVMATVEPDVTEPEPRDETTGSLDDGTATPDFVSISRPSPRDSTP